MIVKILSTYGSIFVGRMAFFMEMSRTSGGIISISMHFKIEFILSLLGPGKSNSSTCGAYVRGISVDSGGYSLIAYVPMERISYRKTQCL